MTEPTDARENEPSAADAAPVPTVDGHGGLGPRWLSGTLLTVATVLAVVATMTTWVRAQVLDTDEWVTASDELLAEPEVVDAVAEYVAEQLFAAVDVTEAVEERLPEQLSGLATPIAGSLLEPATETIERLLRTDEFEELWTAANERVHAATMSILRDEPDRVGVSDGTVTFDLGGAVRSVGERLGVSEAALDRMPADVGQVTLIESTDLEDWQLAVRTIDIMSWVTFVLVVVLYAAAVYVAADRRRALGSLGLWLLAGATVVLVLRAIAIRTGVQLFVDDADEQVAKVVAGVATELLRRMAWTGILAGLIIAGYAALLGDHPWATAIRRRLAAPARSTALVAAVTAVLVWLLVRWAPGGAFAGWTTALVVLALVVGGVSTAVRRIRAEFPPAASQG